MDDVFPLGPDVCHLHRVACCLKNCNVVCGHFSCATSFCPRRYASLEADNIRLVSQWQDTESQLKIMTLLDYDRNVILSPSLIWVLIRPFVNKGLLCVHE